MDNNDRIIGNCLEINGDIIRMRFNNDKFPKFIFSRIKEKYYRYKLIKSVKKLSKANIPLNKNNLIELFAYMHSNFPPYGNYQNIIQVMHVDKNDIDIWKCIIKYSDNMLFTIDIDNKEELFTVVLTVNNPDKNERVNRTVYLKHLATSKEEMKDYIKNLNNIMIKIIMDYILLVIDSSRQLERKK